MLVYPSVVDVSSSTLRFLPQQLRLHRRVSPGPDAQGPGLYSDPDNEIMSLDHLKQMGTGKTQDTFAMGTFNGGITNAVMAATRGHPIAHLEEEALLENYGMTQRKLFDSLSSRYERPVEKMRRNSVLFRTGTALDLATEKEDCPFNGAQYAEP